MLEDELVAVPMRADDGYEPVRLGVLDEGWADDAEEYLHDFHPGDQSVPGPAGIQHIGTGAAEAEDDIVNSYMMARTPMSLGDPAFSPSSTHTTGNVDASPSTGTDHSSPAMRAASTGTTTAVGSGRKWMTGLGIGLGVPKDRALMQNQMRRRTPRSVVVHEGRDSPGTRDDHAQQSRPPLSARSTPVDRAAVSGRGWNWLNGLGIAHVFGTTRGAGQDGGAGGPGWRGQSRIPSSNIWGDLDDLVSLGFGGEPFGS